VSLGGNSAFFGGGRPSGLFFGVSVLFFEGFAGRPLLLRSVLKAFWVAVLKLLVKVDYLRDGSHFEGFSLRDGELFNA